MWLPVSTIAALCVLLDLADGAIPDNELELIFKDRSRSEWEAVWHNERYRRCQETLKRHIHWACEKDIYKLTRRNDPEESKMHNYEIEPNFPWMSEKFARRLLRSRRGSRISSECCTPTGCTWEEYAEYCPSNKRYNTYV